MEARASAKYLRGSAQKARLVIDLIRGKNVNQALAILRYTNKRAALGIEKCVKSAIANANEAAEKANIAVDPDDLWLKAAYVDRGPTKNRRRVRPAPQGRAYRERRHFCHVTILVSSDKQDSGVKTDGQSSAVTPAVSRRAKRGGAAAAPRAKRVSSRSAATDSAKAKSSTKVGEARAAASKEAKGEKKPGKTASKLAKVLQRKKTED
jgi:large subunit ribosomal protein L22